SARSARMTASSTGHITAGDDAEAAPVSVMPAGLVPGIHVLFPCRPCRAKDVDGRVIWHKARFALSPGHDEERASPAMTRKESRSTSGAFAATALPAMRRIGKPLRHLIGC